MAVNDDSANRDDVVGQDGGLGELPVVGWKSGAVVEALARAIEDEALVDEDGEPVTVAGLLEELSSFSNHVEVEIYPGWPYVTAAVVASESGDRELFHEVGVFSSRAVALRAFLNQPSWWGGSFEALSIHDIHVLEF